MVRGETRDACLGACPSASSPAREEYAKRLVSSCDSIGSSMGLAGGRDPGAPTPVDMEKVLMASGLPVTVLNPELSKVYELTK
ncbi:MAG TPA: hypothetical protein VLK82_24280 [Candidatus Tectomicrobia bacterium]|nr:hypothetical protein [Candidatus Tectomicrobia bacterium]